MDRGYSSYMHGMISVIGSASKMKKFYQLISLLCILSGIPMLSMSVLLGIGLILLGAIGLILTAVLKPSPGITGPGLPLDETTMPSDDTPEVPHASAEDLAAIAEQVLSQKVTVSSSSGDRESGSYEYLFYAEKSVHGDQLDALKKQLRKKYPGAYRVLRVSEHSLKVLYIPSV
jgi:hypothetical protein